MRISDWSSDVCSSDLDNHIALAGGVANAVQRARAGVGHMVKIELEVDTLAQLEVALSLGVDVVLLDNMSLDDLRRAVDMARGRAITEASGRSEEHTSELQSLMRISYAVFCLKKKKCTIAQTLT